MTCCSAQIETWEQSGTGLASHRHSFMVWAQARAARTV